MPDKVSARLSPSPNTVEVQLAGAVIALSVLDEIEGLVPPPTMLVTGNPAPSAERRMSMVTEQETSQVTFHLVMVNPLPITPGVVVPAPTGVPIPSTTKVTMCGKSIGVEVAEGVGVAVGVAVAVDVAVAVAVVVGVGVNVAVGVAPVMCVASVKMAIWFGKGVALA